jgi:hypothetical protein
MAVAVTVAAAVAAVAFVVVNGLTIPNLPCPHMSSHRCHTTRRTYTL